MGASARPTSRGTWGRRRAREIWYLCRQYGAEQAERMGLVNAVVPLEELEREGVAWARDILCHSPLAIRMLKSSFNAELDGQAGIQELAGNATLLFYMNEEAQEGRKRVQREARARLFAVSVATVSATPGCDGPVASTGVGTRGAAPDAPGLGRAGPWWALRWRFVEAGVHWPAAVAALVVALLLQIGSNLANDLFDFENGADGDDRIGPPRASQLGLLTPTQMRTGMALVFGAAASAGAYLVWLGGWPIALAGVLSILAALAYTGGPLAVRVPGAGGSSGLSLLRRGGCRRDRIRFRPRRFSAVALAASLPVGCPRHGDSGGQQHAGHRDGRSRRQADPRRAAGPRRGRLGIPATRLRRFRWVALVPAARRGLGPSRSRRLSCCRLPCVSSAWWRRTATAQR